jgi:hypothetical protein
MPGLFWVCDRGFYSLSLSQSLAENTYLFSYPLTRKISDHYLSLSWQ